MLTKDILPELKETAVFFAVERRLQSSGLIGLLFGLACLIGGLVAFGAGWPKWLTVAAGAVFILGALWGIGAPGKPALFGYGGLLLAGGIGGAWALAAFVNTPAGLELGSTPLRLMAIVVVAMVLWGVWNLFYWFSLRKTAVARPDAETEEEAASAIDGLLTADLEQSEDVVELYVVRSLARQQNWRGRLLDGMAVFVEGKGYLVLFAARDEIHLTRLGSKPVKDGVFVCFRCGGVEIPQAFMPSRSIDRYEAWAAKAYAAST